MGLNPHSLSSHKGEPSTPWELGAQRMSPGIRTHVLLQFPATGHVEDSPRAWEPWDLPLLGCENRSSPWEPQLGVRCSPHLGWVRGCCSPAFLNSHPTPSGGHLWSGLLTLLLQLVRGREGAAGPHHPGGFAEMECPPPLRVSSLGHTGPDRQHVPSL